MSNELHSLTDELGHLTSELRSLVTQSQNLALQQRKLLAYSASLQREYAAEVDRTLTPMLGKHSTPSKPRLQG